MQQCPLTSSSHKHVTTTGRRPAQRRVTAQLHRASATHLGFAEEATPTVSFATRASLDQELDRRSDGRLHLDPEQAP